MRKKNVLSYTQDTEKSSSQDLNRSRYKTIEGYSSTNLSSAEKFSSQLLTINQEPLVNFRIKRRRQSELPSISREQIGLQPRQEINKAKEDISNIKRMLRQSKRVNENKVEERITRIVSLLKSSRNQWKAQQFVSSSAQPVYFPVPLPYPYAIQGKRSISPNQSSMNSRLYPHQDQRNHSFGNIFKNTQGDKEYKGKRLKKNMKRWRKIANGILFTLYLKKFCAKIQRNRKESFYKFITKIKPISNSLIRALRQNLQPFFRLLLIKSQINFRVEKDERKEVTRQKILSIRKMIKMILEATKSTISLDVPQYIQLYYTLCKHGNYSCLQQILTLEQLQVSCISKKFQYISSDRYLQKVSIINLVIFKMLITRVLLSPKDISQKLSDNQTICSNLLYLSSIVYQLAMDIQDDLLLKVPKSYQIGNYTHFPFINSMQSMMVSNSTKRQGEIVSGLDDESEIKKIFNIQQWQDEKRSIMMIIKIVSEHIKNLHPKIIQKYY